MENSTNLLKTKINEARAELSQESREAIDSFNWKLIILAMKEKYNEEQLEDLETETELLLCGLLSTEDYPRELETRMKITKEETTSLINELDKQIFKKIQADLERRLDTKEKETNKPFVPDPSFINMPKEVQEAINKSDYKATLYRIASKYKLNVIQMGDLEEITIKVMQNILHPNEYERALASKITIPKEELESLISEVNDNILKKIVNIMKVQESTILTKENKEEVPLPPYKVAINNQPPAPTPISNNLPLNVFEEKLKSATVSDHTVSNYSAPKIPIPQTNNRSGSSDPYREAI